MIYGKRKGGFYIMKAFELLLDILKGAKRENVVDIMLYIILWACLILEIIDYIYRKQRIIFVYGIVKITAINRQYGNSVLFF